MSNGIFLLGTGIINANILVNLCVIFTLHSGVSVVILNLCVLALFHKASNTSLLILLLSKILY
nr:MAG TPA: hypothetical protein [Caudoviricetes sp.]